MVFNRYIIGLDHPESHPFRKDAERLKNQFFTDATVDENGIVRWNKSNNIPPEDILEFWKFLGYEFSYANSVNESERELKIILKNTRNRKPSAEEQYEMRAAFGPGKKVVDVFTGKRYRT